MLSGTAQLPRELYKDAVLRVFADAGVSMQPGRSISRIVKEGSVVSLRKVRRRTYSECTTVILHLLPTGTGRFSKFSHRFFLKKEQVLLPLYRATPECIVTMLKLDYGAMLADQMSATLVWPRVHPTMLLQYATHNNITHPQGARDRRSSSCSSCAVSRTAGRPERAAMAPRTRRESRESASRQRRHNS